MRFYTRKPRTPSIIIVSLIDILAILLIFFIVTTTFRKEQPELQINLPESKTAEKAASSKTEPLILSVDQKEEIKLDGQSVSAADLAARLKALREQYPDRPIAMKAAREANFGVIVSVLDALREAGVKNIPAFTQPQPTSP